MKKKITIREYKKLAVDEKRKYILVAAADGLYYVLLDFLFE